MVALVRAGPPGGSAAQLAEDLFADATRVVTVRAEMSRLRRGLGGTLLAQPYRIAPGVAARLVLPEDRSHAAARLVGSGGPRSAEGRCGHVGLSLR